MKIFFLSLLFALSAIFFIETRSIAQNQIVTLEKDSNIRVDKCETPGENVLCRIGSLPAGTVVEFEKNDFDRAKNFDYELNGKVQRSNNGFVEGFRVVSIPGEEKDPAKEELKNWINNYQDKIFIAKTYLNVTQNNSKFVAGDYTAVVQSEAPLIGRPGRQGPPPPEIETGATAESELVEAAEKAANVKPAGTCDQETFPDQAISGSQFMTQRNAQKVLNFRGLEGVRVPPQALANALNYYAANIKKFKNQRYITIVDYTKSSKQQRMFLIRNDGTVRSYFVAHGRGSGGWAPTQFSNTAGSRATSQGFYSTGGPIDGCSPGKKPCMWLNGLERGLNDNARSREVIFHASDYVANGGMGRSWGCPSVRREDAEVIREATQNGSLWYHYTGETRPTS